MRHALEKKKYFVLSTFVLFGLFVMFILFIINGIETKADDLSAQTSRNVEALKTTP